MNLYLTNLIFFEKYFDNNEYRNLIQNKKNFESLMIERFKCEKNLRLGFVIYIYMNKLFGKCAFIIYLQIENIESLLNIKEMEQSICKLKHACHQKLISLQKRVW